MFDEVDEVIGQMEDRVSHAKDTRDELEEAATLHERAINAIVDLTHHHLFRHWLAEDIYPNTTTTSDQGSGPDDDVLTKQPIIVLWKFKDYIEKYKQQLLEDLTNGPVRREREDN